MLTAVRRLLPHLPVAILIGLYVARFALLSVQIQDGYGDPGYDMGIFDQGVWLLSRFHAPFVTVMGRNLFGDHTSFILLLAVPLYWIWPAANTLLVLQTCLIAGGAVVVYLLGRRRLGNIPLATVLAGAYLLNPALQQGNLEQFHPEAFLVLSVAVAIYGSVESKPVLLAIGVAASLLVKEDSWLLMVPLGLWVLLRRNRIWGTVILASSISWAFLATQVVIRLLLGTTSFYSNRVPFGGFGGLLAAPFVHAGRFVKYVRGGGRPFYVWQMGASFGWVMLIAPEIAAIGLLTLAENTLSLFPYMQQITRHYSLSLVPVFALGTVYAVSRLPRLQLRAAATAVVACSAVVSSVMWGVLPFSRGSIADEFPHAPPSVARATDVALRAIPPHAVVSASYEFVSHLDHRVQVYQWPTPFRATYWALYTQEGQRLPMADQVQYLALPTNFADFPQVLASIGSHFTLIAAGGIVAVYERNGT